MLMLVIVWIVKVHPGVSVVDVSDCVRVYLASVLVMVVVMLTLVVP